MAADNITACYEGIQRIYRNAVVGHLRKFLTSSFPDDFQDRIKHPFKKEWEKITASANERRKTGELSSPIRDDFDLLGVNHFYNIFDAYYDMLCPQDREADETQRKTNKQVLIQWMKTVKNLRDPLSHPSESDFSYEDSFILLESARRVLVRLGLKSQADSIGHLERNLSGRPLIGEQTKEPLEDRLPAKESIVVEFVGRGDELKSLWLWFQDPGSRRWILAGEGGKGKSALAYRFATEVKATAPEPYHIVIWLSAKRKRFQEGTVIAIESPDFHDLDSALSYILSSYGWAEEASQPLEKKRERALELLDAFPALVVVDDVDSVEQKDEAAIEFFTYITGKTKSKTLLTTRRQPFGLGGSTTHIEGLNRSDAQKFIYSRCRLLGLASNALTVSQIRQVIEVTEASPLYLEDLMRLITIMPPREAIKEWKEKRGEEARKYALGRELDLQSSYAREVLLAACISPGPVSFAELEVVTGLPRGSLLDALRDLQRLFLVPKPVLIEGEHRYDININTRTLVISSEKDTDLYRRVEAAFHAAVKGIRQIGHDEISGIIRQAVFLVKSREYTEAKDLLCRALEKFPSNPNLVGFLGWVYKAWHPPRVTAAREKFRRAWQLKGDDERMYMHWARMELDEHEWTRAAEAAEKGLKYLPSSRQLLYLAGKARSRLGKELLGGLHREKGNLEIVRSREYLEKALKAPEELDVGERRLNADVYRALVLNCEATGNSSLMKKYFRQWLAEHPDDQDVHSEWSRLSRKFGLNRKPGTKS